MARPGANRHGWRSRADRPARGQTPPRVRRPSPPAPPAPATFTTPRGFLIAWPGRGRRRGGREDDRTTDPGMDARGPRGWGGARTGEGPDHDSKGKEAGRRRAKTLSGPGGGRKRDDRNQSNGGTGQTRNGSPTGRTAQTRTGRPWMADDHIGRRARGARPVCPFLDLPPALDPGLAGERSESKRRAKRVPRRSATRSGSASKTSGLCPAVASIR